MRRDTHCFRVDVNDVTVAEIAGKSAITALVRYNMPGNWNVIKANCKRIGRATGGRAKFMCGTTEYTLRPRN